MNALTKPGLALYSDGESISYEPYNGLEHKYYCGKEYCKPVTKEFLPYLLVVIDADEATIGLTNGDRIEVLWTDTSFVPRKHDAGGQSARRFERGREEALTQWLRKVKDIIKGNGYFKDRELIIGGPGMTKERFVKELPTYFRVAKTESCGYTDLAGLYEIIGKSRYVHGDKVAPGP